MSNQLDDSTRWMKVCCMGQRSINRSMHPSVAGGVEKLVPNSSFTAAADTDLLPQFSDNQRDQYHPLS